jgi:hypothetical protein
MVAVIVVLILVMGYFVKRIGMTVVYSGVAVVVVMDMVLEELSCQMPWVL